MLYCLLMLYCLNVSILLTFPTSGFLLARIWTRVQVSNDYSRRGNSLFNFNQTSAFDKNQVRLMQLNSHRDVVLYSCVMLYDEVCLC
uniref:Uncharacterized protein n=1 Tax=Anguilla anguilla TaxID=7936 RepID=A0A0E9WPB7_ANGAN